LQLFLLALGPSLFWLWWFWSQEKGQRESLQLLARTFVFGAVSVIPAIVLEFFAGAKLMLPETVECFFIIGPVEELCKLLATYIAVRNEDCFDKPADGIVYAAAASLGFAFAENLYYFASSDTHTFIMRAGLSVPMHALSAIPWAVALGRLKCDSQAPKRIMFSGFVIASILHGLFDALCFQIHFAHDTTLLILLALTLFEWRLYVLSVSEMLRLGRRLMRRRMFSSSRLRTQNSSVEPFKLRWFLLPLVFSTIICTSVWILLKALAFKLDSGSAFHADTAVVSIIILSIGVYVAYRSPGHTVRESALALALSGFALSFLASWPSANPIESGVYFAALGAFGSWLGEMLQDHELRRIEPLEDFSSTQKC
jgi:RsiW-degrading membrane proteinase PrsW (M82 family)